MTMMSARPRQSSAARGKIWAAVAAVVVIAALGFAWTRVRSRECCSGGAAVRGRAVHAAHYYNTYALTGGVGTLYKVPILGGTPQRILEDVDSACRFRPTAPHS